MQEIINLINTFTNNNSYNSNVKGKLQKLNQIFQIHENLYKGKENHPNIKKVMFRMYRNLCENYILPNFKEIHHLNLLEEALMIKDPDDISKNIGEVFDLYDKSSAKGLQRLGDNIKDEDFGKIDYEFFKLHISLIPLKKKS